MPSPILPARKSNGRRLVIALTDSLRAPAPRHFTAVLPAAHLSLGRTLRTGELPCSPGPPLKHAARVCLCA